MSDAAYLDIAAAWRACGHADTETIPPDFEDYVDVAISHVAALIGHAHEITEVVRVPSPAADVILPWSDGSITVRDADRVELTGWTRDGVTLSGTWSTDHLIVVGVGFTVPKVVKLAAAQICRQMWLADRAGNTGGRPSSSGETKVPQGFAVPKRARELLDPYLRRFW